MKSWLLFSFCACLGFGAFAQGSQSYDSTVRGKIPIFPSRWYQLNNTKIGLDQLFDGINQYDIGMGWGLMFDNWDSYYEVLPGEKIIIDSIRLFDGNGSCNSNPLRIYAINGNWERKLVATFKGNLWGSWEGPYPDRLSTFKLDSAITDIKYLVINSGGVYPGEIELYGNYKSPYTTATTIATRKPKLKDLLGINGYEYNLMNSSSPSVVEPAYLAAANSFTGFRHYLDWDKLENTQGTFAFDATSNGSWNIDTLYSVLKSNGLEVSACLSNVPAWLKSTYPSGKQNKRNVPTVYGRDLALPASYVEHAKLGFQFAARYGRNANIASSLLLSATKRVGLGTVCYMECNNEPDKSDDGRNAYQTAREYAADLSAFYDGHKGTLGQGVGVKTADTTMKVVMAASSDASVNFLKALIDWCKEFRGYKADGSVDVPWDAINLHYFPNNAKTNGTSNRGAAPEQSFADSIASAFIYISKNYTGYKPVWVTETGYEQSQWSGQKAIAIGSKSVEQTQADWTLRTALQYARTGIDKVFHYQFLNDYGAKYPTSGLISDNSNRTRTAAADFAMQVKNKFGGYAFACNLSQSPLVDKYLLDTNKLFVLTMPTENGSTASYTLSLGNADSAFVYVPTKGSAQMTETHLATVNGAIALTVTETPTFVVPFTIASAPVVPVVNDSTVKGKIAIDPKRWYQLNNSSYRLDKLFDGQTQYSIDFGWGRMLSNWDSYYPVLPGEKIVIDSIRMFDGNGTNESYPFTLYAIDSNWNRIQIARFLGTTWGNWVGPYPNRLGTFKLDTAVKNIMYLVINTYGDVPGELELYGRYKAPTAQPTIATRRATLSNFFGVNGYEWNFENGAVDATKIDTNLMNIVKNFTGVRHYLDWQKLENTKGSYTYNPTRNGGWNYDTIYDACKKNGIEVLACIKTIPSWMIASYPSGQQDYENTPVYYGSDLSSPASYTDQAKVAFQYAARYGRNPNVDASLLSVNGTQRWTGDQINTVRRGLGTIRYMECDNERDKTWKGRSAYQTGREYAANMSAFYDGHKGTLGAGVGVKNADSTMQVVMAGLSFATTDYVRGMIDWCKEFRGLKADGSVNYAWDVINYHIYSSDASFQSNGYPTRGMAPEKSNCDSIAGAFVEMSKQYAGYMPVWVTEAGYDINEWSHYKAPAIGNKTALLTQADWILRTSLLYARKGIEKVFFFQLYDDNPGSGAEYATSGLVNEDKTLRPSAQFIAQVNKQFGKYSYSRSLSASPLVDQYVKASPTDTLNMYMLTMPTEDGSTANYNLDLGNADSAFVYVPTDGASKMQETHLATTNGIITAVVTETPIFIVPAWKKPASALGDDSTLKGKIAIDPARWYQLNNGSNFFPQLFDGQNQYNIETGWGKMFDNWDSYYPVMPGEKIIIDSVRMFDGNGTCENNPTTLYVIDDQWNRIPFATFTGSTWGNWVGPYPNRTGTFKLDTALTNIRYILINTWGGSLPGEIELYGRYKAPYPTPDIATRRKPLSNFFGVNAYEWYFENGAIDPTSIDSGSFKVIKNFTGVRHYMDWQKLEFTEGKYTYNPTHAGGWNYDTIYDACKKNNIDVLACMKTVPDWMVNTYPADQRTNELAPLEYGSDKTVPASYLKQAKLAFQYTARYGRNKNVDPALLSVDARQRWTGDPVNALRIGLGTIKYLECDNERDKYWKGRAAYQTGREYAANMSAFYDGHKGTMGPGVGVKNADSSMQVVMGGLATASTDYVKGMIDWCKEFRGYKSDGTVNLAWDIINYHYYSNDASKQSNGYPTRGTAPETSGSDLVANDFVKMSKQFAGYMPVWLTETGYDINQWSSQKSIPIGNRTAEQTQGDWVLRSSLLYARTGIEKLFFYQLYDDNPGAGGQYATSGLMDSLGRKRTATYFISQVNRKFGNYSFVSSNFGSPLVDYYANPKPNGDTARMYMLVMPTETGASSARSLALPGADSAIVYLPTDSGEDMIETKLPVVNGSVSITVTETPRFVVPVVNGQSPFGRKADNGLIQAEKANAQLTFYPNPTSDKLFVSGVAPEATLTVYSSDNKAVLAKQSNAKGAAVVDVRALPKGVYFLSVQGQAGKTVKSFVVNK